LEDLRTSEVSLPPAHPVPLALLAAFIDVRELVWVADGHAVHEVLQLGVEHLLHVVISSHSIIYDDREHFPPALLLPKP